MATHQEIPLLHSIREAVFPFGDETSDGELLRRFAMRRDEDAFTALVRRHGALVLGAAGRVLGRHQDAEDVCQATFLLLARKAGALPWRDSVVHWLYAAAHRMALQARRAAQRRDARELNITPKPQPNALTEITARDLREILDQELTRLPNKYAAPVFLCCLEGRSRDEAARSLNLPLSTVKSRLEEGRELLRRRLTRRGVELATALACATLTPDAAPAASFARNTCAAALKFAAGESTAGLVSARVLALMQMGANALLLTKFKIAAAVVVAIGLAGGGVVALSQNAPAPAHADAVKKANEAPPAKADDPKPAAKIEPLAWKEKTVLKTQHWIVGSVAYSPDGKTLVAGGLDVANRGKVAAYNIADFNEQWTAHVSANFAAVAFSPDGKSVFATSKDGLTLLDVATGNVTGSVTEKDSHPLAVGVFPDRRIAFDNGVVTSRKIIFGNARGYFVQQRFDDGEPGTIQLTNVAAGKKPADANAVPLAIDPAGRSAIIASPINPETGRNGLWAWVAGDYSKDSPGNRILKGHDAAVVSAAWSKDGTTAVTGDAAGRVIVWDAASMIPFAQGGEFGARVAALAISGDSKYTAALVVGKQAEVYVWKTHRATNDLQPIQTLAWDFDGSIHASLAFSPNDRQLAGSVLNKGWLMNTGVLVGAVHIWELDAWPPPGAALPIPASRLDWSVGKRIADPQYDVRALATSPNGKTFAADTGGKSIVFETATSKKLYEVPGRFPRFVGDELIAWEKGAAVRYDAATGAQKSGATKPFASFERGQISPDGKSIAGCNVGGVEVIDLITGVKRIPNPQDGSEDAWTFPVNDVVWSPDGKLLAGPYGSKVVDPLEEVIPGGLAIWDVAALKQPSGKERARLEKTAAPSGRLMTFAFSPDCKSLVVAGRTHDARAVREGGVSVELRDAATLKLIRQTNINSRDGGADVTAVAFSPDGQTVAIAAHLHSGKSPYIRVHLWNTATGDVNVLMSYDFAGFISSLAFTPDGTKLITATSSVTARGEPLQPTAVRDEPLVHGILIWHGEPKK